VLPGWKKAFPELVSYNRFIELIPNPGFYPLYSGVCLRRLRLCSRDF
jgi:hypothetical protein